MHRVTDPHRASAVWLAVGDPTVLLGDLDHRVQLDAVLAVLAALALARTALAVRAACHVPPRRHGSRTPPGHRQESSENRM